MRLWLQSVSKWWNDWVGDKDTENSIRQRLQQEGYYGQTAELSNVRLVAIERPGWVQVYRFEVKARVKLEPAEVDGPDPPAQYRNLCGLVLQDYRKSISDVRLFDHPDPRRTQFRSWAEGLIQLRGAEGLS